MCLFDISVWHDLTPTNVRILTFSMVLIKEFSLSCLHVTFVGSGLTAAGLGISRFRFTSFDARVVRGKQPTRLIALSWWTNYTPTVVKCMCVVKTLKSSIQDMWCRLLSTCRDCDLFWSLNVPLDCRLTHSVDVCGTLRFCVTVIHYRMHLASHSCTHSLSRTPSVPLLHSFILACT